MQIAPSFPIRTATPPRHNDVTFVDRDLAAGLLSNFLTALDADDAAQRSVFMQYARLTAERHLATWGVVR